LYNANSVRIMNKEFLQIAENDANSMAKTLELVLKEIDMLSSSLLLDDDIRLFIASGTTEKKYEGFTNNTQQMIGKINTYSIIYNYIESIYLYSESYKSVFKGSGEYSLESVEDSQWINEYNVCNKFVAFPRAINGKYPYVLTFIRKIERSDIKGGIVININLEELLGVVETAKSDSQQKIIIDNEGKILYKNNMDLMFEKSEKLSNVSADFEGQQLMKDEDGSFVVAVKPSSKYKIKYMVLNELNDYENNMGQSRNILIIILCGLFILGTIIAAIYSIIINRPIQWLVELIDSSQGLGGDNKEKGSEVKYVAEKIINAMHANEKLKMELSDKLTKMAALEMCALKLQINPHFIYNSLNLVNLKLLNEFGADYPGIDVITNLSQIMRYVIKNDDNLISIGDEVKYSELFARILQRRNRGSFELRVVVDEKVKNAKMPKLILFTLIENAMYHGILPSENENSFIALTVFKQGDEVLLEITDNGVGITKEKMLEIEKIFLDERIEGTEHIGLKNIQQRIKIMFGFEYGISIKSNEGVGTTISILIPYIE